MPIPTKPNPVSTLSNEPPAVLAGDTTDEVLVALEELEVVAALDLAVAFAETLDDVGLVPGQYSTAGDLM